ncbi:hypothetical protein K1719_023966 [Acacia pycnantha]|nr:hypothetical protein K1719_023966 [Acacia pycnantha]
MDFMDMPANDDKDLLGHSLKVESDIEKKWKYKDKKNKCSTDEALNLNKVVEENSIGIAAKGQDCSSEGDAMKNGEENNKSKRKKRKKGKDKDEIISGIIDGDNEMQFLDDKQERKTKKRKNRYDSIPEMQEGFALESRSENNEGANTHSVVTNNDDQGKKIKKKEKAKAKEKEKLTSKGEIIEDNELRNNGGDRASAESHESDPHLTEINMGDAIEHANSTKSDDQGKKKKKMKNKSKEDKRVTFSDQVEVFNDGLVQGKRFTIEEDEKIKEAIYSYIDAHGLGDHDQGVDMILHCSSHPKLRGCWKEIASALPHRPLESVYHRGHILFERDDSHKWTPEELEIIRNFHEKHGPNWKMLADAMGKHRFHVKDAWRRIKLGDVKKGHWSQDEYQKLFNLVNADLSMRALEDTRKYKHGEWADTDDYRLLNALYTLDDCSMEEVEWDHLLEHRSGDVCRKRWNQMVQHIGEHGIKSFSEQVGILSERYCPDLVEAREAFDSKPVVP